MDYHAIHGHDVSSFDLPSTRKFKRLPCAFWQTEVPLPFPPATADGSTRDRLPTVSAAKALEDFQGNRSNYVSTGLTALDASLGSVLDGSSVGGIQKGYVTEIWGPPGAGKTAIGYVLQDETGDMPRHPHKALCFSN